MDSSTKLAPALCQAAEQNNIAKARELVAAGAHPNIIPLGDDRTPLWYASVNGHVEMINYLHSLGVALNGYSQGATALYAAAMKNQVNAARALVNAGADVNAGFPNTVPILVAASSGSNDVLKFLVTIPKINLDERDNGGYSAVCHAAFEGHLEAVKILAATKVDTSKALRIAKDKRHTAIVELLEQIQPK
jgi:ankyrin repeat protein